MTVPAPCPLLLVEDDPAIAETVTYALAREGMITTHCLLLQDARLQLEQQAYAALILDIGLPDGSGLDFCRELRQQAATATLPILMLSARSDEFDRVLGLELGRMTISASRSARANWWHVCAPCCGAAGR